MFYFFKDAVADAAYEEQLRNQKEKTKVMREMDQRREMDHRMQPNMSSGGGNLLAGLGGLGALGGLGGMGVMGSQTANGLIQMLTMRGGEPINATVFISNVSC